MNGQATGPKPPAGPSTPPPPPGPKAIEVFQFPETGQPLRSVHAGGEANFVAADAATVLELGNVSSSLALLDDDEKGLHTVETPGGPQQMATVTEAGLYSLILRSRKPQAKAFKRWITHEVLPSIRKTGSYGTPRELSRLEILELAMDSERRAVAAESQVAVLAPAADAWNHLASAEGDFSVADAAKILSRDPQISVGRDRLFTHMSRWGWVYRPGGFDRWRVYQTQIETGRLSELPSSHYHPRTGELVLDPPQVRVTAKGLQEIRNRLTKER